MREGPGTRPGPTGLAHVSFGGWVGSENTDKTSLKADREDWGEGARRTAPGGTAPRRTAPGGAALRITKSMQKPNKSLPGTTRGLQNPCRKHQERSRTSRNNFFNSFEHLSNHCTRKATSKPKGTPEPEPESEEDYSQFQPQPQDHARRSP